MDKLEVDGDEVDDDKEGGNVGGGTDIQQDLRVGSEQVDRKASSLLGGEDAKSLLDGVGNEDHTEGNEHSNGTAIVPGPLTTGHGKCHGKGDPHAGVEGEADEVKPLHTVHDGHAGDGVMRRKAGQVKRATDGTDDEVNVESPSPGSTRGSEGTTDYRAQYGADTPAESRESDVETTLFGSSQDTEVV